MEYVIDIPFSSPKFNHQTTLNKRRTWKKKCFRAVSDFVYDDDNLPIPRFRENVKITYERHSRIPMDQDGVAQTAKYFLDALTHNGIIKDDKPISAGGHVDIHFVSKKGEPRTIITITEI